MTVVARYHAGGYIAAAPAQNKAEELGAQYRRWDTGGVLLETRALTADESALVAAQLAAETAQTNTNTIRSRAATALTTNATFLAIASPSTAQVATQVKALTRQCDGVIRLMLNQLDTITDT
jgi:hypothetical protein